MTKILYVVSSLHRNGPINIFYAIIKQLDRTKFQPVILTLSKEKNNSRINDFTSLDIEVFCCNLNSIDWFNFGIFKFKKMLAQIAPQVIQTTGIRGDILTAFFSPKQCITITSVMNNPFEDYNTIYGNVVGNVMIHFTKKITPKYTYAIPCSNYIKEVMLKQNVITNHVIYNCIDVSQDKKLTDEEKNNLKKELGIINNEIIFVFSGVLTERKLPNVAIKAFNLFVAQNPNSALLILGDGDKMEECKSLVNSNKIKILGFVNNPSSYLSISDYYIATSSAEGLPASVLEALSLGVPVVLSNIKPHAEILAFNKNAGELCEVNNIESTLNAMNNLKKGNKQLQQISAVEIIEKNLSSTIISNQYQQLYK